MKRRAPQHIRERELKYELESSGDWQRLCAKLPGFEAELEQHNSYWDTADRDLRRLGATLRLRRESSERSRRAVLTLKTGKQRAQGLFEADELEAIVDDVIAAAVEAGKQPLGALESGVLAHIATLPVAIDRLRPWGRLDNLRKRFRIAPELCVEVDHTMLLDPTGGRRAREYWEVELECTDVESARRELERWLDAAQARHRLQTQTKAERLGEFLASDEVSP